MNGMKRVESGSMIAKYMDDISQDEARQAFYWVSQDPEGRGERERIQYSRQMLDCWQWGQNYARNDSEWATFEAWFVKYRKKMRSLWRAWLHSSSRCASSFITGAGNFPTRKMEKRQRWAENHLERLLEIQAWMKKKIARDMRPEERPIMAGDADAVERLKAEIEQAEKHQDFMKQVNNIIRKNKRNTFEEQVNLLVEQTGLERIKAQKLLTPDCYGLKGYPNYRLTNNNANIRRMKMRLAQIERNKSKPDFKCEGIDGIKLEDCPAENRVKIFFPGIPAQEIRATLKGCGYRWTPSQGCWQAYRNNRTIELAKTFMIKKEG